MARKAKIEEINNRFERRHTGRRVGTRNPRTYFLIVCGGEKTEKFYFDSLKEKLPVNSVQVHTKGEKRDPLRVVKTALRLKESPGTVKYDEVWVVFDKDFFDNFDEAIREAERNHISCAWSNVAFELWYALHFRDIESALTQKECEKCIEKAVKTQLKGFVYNKANKNLYNILEQYGDSKKAEQRAAALVAKYNNSNYSTHNPCTRVHELVKKLKKHITPYYPGSPSASTISRT